MPACAPPQRKKSAISEPEAVYQLRVQENDVIVVGGIGVLLVLIVQRALEPQRLADRLRQQYRNSVEMVVRARDSHRVREGSRRCVAPDARLQRNDGQPAANAR